MNPNEEAYVHYAECINSLNRARQILGELRAIDRKTAIHAAAFRFALIEYAKPYTRSDGIHKRGRNGYVLPRPKLSAKLLTLHKQILVLRRKVLAHTDLTLKEAQVYIASHAGRLLVAVEIERLKNNLRPNA